MGDSDFNVATLELTKEILDDLGITSTLKEGYFKLLKEAPAVEAPAVIDEYAKYFRQLRTGLTTSIKE